VWAHWYPLGSLGSAQATFFDVLDQVTSNMLLPIGGLALAIFGGWIVPKDLLVAELQFGQVGIFLFRTLLRYVAPVAIAATSVAMLRF
jgi:NSS family neurotransmitter:Na+ symporter